MLVPMHAEPAQVVLDRVLVFGPVALGVGVVEAQQERRRHAAGRAGSWPAPARTLPTCSSPVGLGAKRTFTSVLRLAVRRAGRGCASRGRRGWPGARRSRAARRRCASPARRRPARSRPRRRRTRRPAPPWRPCPAPGTARRCRARSGGRTGWRRRASGTGRSPRRCCPRRRPDRSRMRTRQVLASLIRADSAPSPLRCARLRCAAQQELAADLHPDLVAIGHDVGGGVGLVPVARDEAAGADDVDRRLRVGHDPAFLDAEAGRDDDPHLGEAGLVQRLAHAPDRRGRDAGADQVAQFGVAAVAADGARRAALEHGVAARPGRALRGSGRHGCRAGPRAGRRRPGRGSARQTSSPSVISRPK